MKMSKTQSEGLVTIIVVLFVGVLTVAFILYAYNDFNKMRRELQQEMQSYRCTCESGPDAANEYEIRPVGAAANIP